MLIMSKGKGSGRHRDLSLGALQNDKEVPAFFRVYLKRKAAEKNEEEARLHERDIEYAAAMLLAVQKGGFTARVW